MLSEKTRYTLIVVAFIVFAGYIVFYLLEDRSQEKARQYIEQNISAQTGPTGPSGPACYPDDGPACYPEGYVVPTIDLTPSPTASPSPTVSL